PTAASTAGGGTFCNSLYVGVSGTLYFAPGETTKMVLVDAVDCIRTGHVTGVQTFALPINPSITLASTRIGIVGDGNVTASPGLYARDAVVDTDAGTVDVPVLVGGPAGSAPSSVVTVKYATHDGTATAGSDYTATSGTLTFG